MVFFLRAIALAGVAALATAEVSTTTHHHVKHHHHHTTEAHEQHKLRFSAPLVMNGGEKGVDDDSDSDSDNDVVLESEAPKCTKDDLKAFVRFAAEPTFTALCGAENADNLQKMSFWTLDLCKSVDCWSYVNDSLETKVPHCKFGSITLAHYLMSRLKYCDVVGGLQVFPKCGKDTDEALRKLSKAANIEAECGAAIAKNFTVHGLSSIAVCGNERCVSTLLALNAQLPICKHETRLLQDMIFDVVSQCANDCSTEDYDIISSVATTEPLVGMFCGNATVEAFKTHSMQDIDVCASPECNALMYLIKQDGLLPLCFEDGELLRDPFEESLIKC